MATLNPIDLAAGMKRRDVLTLIGGAAAIFPSLAPAQPSGQLPGFRRLGVLTTLVEDTFSKPLAAALVSGLADLGWNVGGNLGIEWRFAGGDPAQLARNADELVALAPDALIAFDSPSVKALRRRTRKIPITFTGVADPVGQGFVESLSRPGGNVTGFSLLETSMGVKWTEMLTEITPPVATVAVLYNPATAPLMDRMMQLVAEAASAHGATARAALVSDEAGIEAAVAISREKRPGLLVPPDTFNLVHRAAIIGVAARAQLPAAYFNRVFVQEGGLMSYSVDTIDLYRRSAGYIDRIFKGADPGELPVQNPTKFQTLLNLKTAKTLGVEFPPTLLAAADEVIE